jgi:hypothetical protein
MKQTKSFRIITNHIDYRYNTYGYETKQTIGCACPERKCRYADCIELVRDSHVICCILIQNPERLVCVAEFMRNGNTFPEEETP